MKKEVKSMILESVMSNVSYVIQWATKLFECLVVLDSFSCNSRNKMAKNMKKYNLESPVSEVSENIHIYTIIFVCC